MKKISFIAMLLAVTMMVIGTLSTASAAGQTETTSLVVKLINGLTAVEQTAVINRDGGIETSSVPALRLHVVTVPTANLSLILGSYQTDPQVQSVELNKIRKAESIPGDANYGLQWALSKIGWESTFGNITPSGSAKLALLDTGVDASHPDLGSNIISGTSILNGTNGLSDPNGHGTSLAGIIAAMTDNGQGIAGISYAGVKIMPVTVLNENGIGQDSDIITGIIWAADNGANVILMGFSNPDFSQNLQDAIDYAWSKGAVMVAAAGNDGLSAPTFPAGNRGVVGVSATNQYDTLYIGSNYGQHIFMAAPGTDIYTTGLGNSYNYISGTSASSAVVAGVAAFMKAVDPTLTNGVIVGRLASSADAIGTLGDPSNPVMFGNGRVNMANALADIGTDEVQPAGASPVGNGGPFVGPYVAACYPELVLSPNSGLPGTVVNASGSLHGNKKIVTIKFAGTTVATSPATCITQSGGSFACSFTIPTGTAGNNTVTSASNQASASATFALLKLDQAIFVDSPVPVDPPYGSTFNVAAHADSGLPVAITANGSCSVTDVNIPVAVSMTSASGSCVIEYNQLGNTNFNAATKVTKSTNAKARPITITADAVSKTYGATDPALTYQITSGSLVNNDTISGALVRSIGENVGTYAILQGTLTASNKYAVTYVGANLTINNATAALALSGLAQTYDGAAKSATVTTAPLSLTGVTITYDGSASAPTAPGNYAVVAKLVNANYQATDATGTLVISKAPATLALSGLAQTYDGTAKSATVTTAPLSLTGVTITYDGSASAPTAPGNYAVVAKLVNANYQATDATGTLVISKAPATLALSGLAQTYDGTAKSATVTTAPLSLTGVTITYDGSASAPTAPGNYAVVAKLVNTNYQATDATGTLVISKAPATLALSGLAQTYDGTAKSATVTTAPLSLTGVTITYDGSASAPTAPGSYAVVAKLDNANYQATDAIGTLVISKGSASLTLSGLTQAYDGTPKSATVTTSPANLTGVSVTYAGLATLPTNAGSYAVVATLTNNNYDAANATGTLVISKATTTITWATPAAINNMTPLSSTQLNAVASVPGTYVYTPASGAILGAGNQILSVIFTPTDTNYSTVSATVTINVVPVPPCVAPSYLSIPTNNSSGNFTVYWGSSSNCSGATFVIEQSSNGTDYTPVSSSTGTSKTINVTANGTYTYRVKATKTNYADSGYTPGSNTCNVALKCGVPSFLAVPESNSTGSMTLYWGNSDVSGVSYTLEQSLNGGQYTQIYSGTGTSKAITVAANGTYTYRVMATKANSNYADSDYTTTNSCSVVLKCGVPSFLEVPVSNTTGSMTLYWGNSDVSGVSYNLEQSFNGGQYSQIYSGTGTSKSLILTADGTYTYRVMVTKTGSNYADSDYTTTKACIVALKCGTPALLTIPTTSSTGTMYITWGNSDISGVTYILEQSLNGGGYTPAYSGTSLYANITVAANGSYTYRVRATKAGYADSDTTIGSNACSVVLKCGAPASLTVQATSTTGTIYVSWGNSDISSPVTYILEQSFNGGAYAQISSTTLLYANITVAANGSYTYRVRATKTGYADSDTTIGSNACSVVLKCGAPATVTIPATSTDGKMYITWGNSDVSSPVTYILEQSFNGGAYAQISSTISLYANITVVANGSYTYRVRATKTGYADSDTTIGSNACSVVLTCGAPASLTVPATSTTGSIYVSWGTSSTSGVTYILEQSLNGGGYTTIYSGTGTSKTITATAGTYTYRVSATKTGYISSNYATTNSCNVTLSCGAPASLTVPTTNTTGTMTVSWAAGSVSGVNYILEQSISGGAYTTIYSGTSLYKVVTVTANGTYTYRVSATKAGYSNSDYTTTNTCNVALSCDAPASLTVPATNTTGSVYVSWAAGLNNISGVTYILEQSSNNGLTYTQVYSGTSLYKFVTVANGTYKYRVKATKSGYTPSSYTDSSVSCIVTK